MSKKKLSSEEFYPHSNPPEFNKMWDNMGEMSEIVDSLYNEGFSLQWKVNEIKDVDAKDFNEKIEAALKAFYKMFKQTSIEGLTQYLEHLKSQKQKEISEKEYEFNKQIQDVEDRIKEINRKF